MKVSLLLSSAVLALAAATGAPAQTTPASTLKALPPPSIDDPGTRPAPAASSPLPREGDADPMAVPLPELPGGTATDPRGEPAPTVKVKKHDGKLIEEYYRGGNLYMVRVHPAHGVPYTYFVDENRRLNRAAGAPPVDPVLYKVLEWGQPKGKRGGDAD